MTKLKSKYINFGTGSNEVSSKVLPAGYTPVNYTPIEVSSEGADKTSAHLKGIDSKLVAGGWITSIKVAAAGGATNYTASSRDEIFTDTLTNSDTMTITLPSSPVIGNRVKIIDGKNDWSVNNVTVGRNGSNIDGLSSDFTLNVGGSWIEFIYMDETEGWRTIT